MATENNSTPQPSLLTAQTKNPMVHNVAEIFNCAGFAFKKLGELVQQLDGTSENNTNAESVKKNPQQPQTHWEDADIEQFRNIVTNFTEELTTLSNNLKNRMQNKLKEEHMDTAVKALSPADREILMKPESSNSVLSTVVKTE